MLAEKPKVTVIVPAYNEEKQLRAGVANGFFRALKTWQSVDRANRSIVLVNDGSTDGTARVARAQGISVIDSHSDGKNLGKGGAVARGFAHAVEKGASVAVTLDADILDLTPDKIDALARPITHPRGSPPNMVIGKNLEGPLISDADENFLLSGQRAFRLAAVHPLISGAESAEKWRSLCEGFGLEVALNHLVRSRVFANVFFSCAPAFRSGAFDQLEQSELAALKISHRLEIARRLREMKKSGATNAELKAFLDREKRAHSHLR